jgi:hypothetical protein
MFMVLKWKNLSHTSEFYYSAARRTEHDLARLCEVILEHLGTIFVLL